MKPSLLLLCLAVTAGSAQAGDVTAPVREIMAEAENGWSETPAGDPRDYFDQDRLTRIYSADFAAAYRAAAKFPAYEDGDSPLDYDVIVSGQDSCTLKDIRIVPGPTSDGLTDVGVTFDNTSCLDEQAEHGPAELRFRIVEENGHPAIDDILRGGAQGSLKAELIGIAAAGAQ